MDELIRALETSGALTSTRIRNAFKRMDRGNFVIPEYKDFAYEDRPLPIGYGQTISQPTTVALMLELLNPKKGERVLDIGSGSGWTTALLSALVGVDGEVLGIEIIPELVELGAMHLKKYRLPQGNIIRAKKQTLGSPSKAPFDRILVSASSKKFPHALVNQLRAGGVIVIPIGSAIWKVTRTSKKTLDIKNTPVSCLSLCVLLLVKAHRGKQFSKITNYFFVVRYPVHRKNIEASS